MPFLVGTSCPEEALQLKAKGELPLTALSCKAVNAMAEAAQNHCMI